MRTESHHRFVVRIFLFDQRSLLDQNEDSSKLAVNSNGGVHELSVSIQKIEDNVPEHWHFKKSTGNNATIILPTSANPNIENIPL